MVGLFSVMCGYVGGQNVNKVIYPYYAENTRQEVRVPSALEGYIALKADLHTHTYFSDGSVICRYAVWMRLGKLDLTYWLSRTILSIRLIVNT